MNPGLKTLQAFNVVDLFDFTMKRNAKLGLSYKHHFNTPHFYWRQWLPLITGVYTS